MKKNIKLAIAILLSLFFSIIITEVIQYRSINLSNIFHINFFLESIALVFSFYLFSHFVFKIKDIYDFIYKKRYLISIGLLIIIVLGRFNGSSIGLWNGIVEPDNYFSKYTLIGKNREIRSDEWNVNTPYAISQQYNDYKYFNDSPRAEKTDMFSTIFVPVKDILILARPFNIGYLILGEEYGLSFYWYGRLIALLLVSFEVMMLITNKKKLLSLTGAIIIAGSPVVSWFYSNYIVDLLISGQLCLLLFNEYLKNKNIKLRILFSVLLGLSFSWFILTIYPAWQVPLGYMYLAFAIWIFIKNFKDNKSIKDYLFLLITITIIFLMLLRYYMLSKNTLDILLNTTYPGDRVVTGGGALIKHFIYPISIFFVVADYHNPCEASGVYSLFPIPIMISIIYLISLKIKKDKNNINILILLLTIVAIFLTTFTLIPFPEIIAKITLLSMSPTERVAPIIGIICAYLIVLTTQKIEIKKNWSKIVLLFFTLLISYVIIKTGSLDRAWYLTGKKIIVALILLTLTIYFYIDSKPKRNEFILCILLIMIGSINIALVNPVNIGTSVLHNKKTAKEINKIVKKDKEANWLSTNGVLGNYVIANGGQAINSTNIYPNLKLWKKIDADKEYEDLYNRYAHILVYFTEEETKFELVQQDVLALYLNYDDIDDLEVEYIISSEELNIDEDYKDIIQTIYHYDNIWIYQYT